MYLKLLFFGNGNGFLMRTKFMKCFYFDFLEKCWRGLEEFALELVQKKENENVTVYTAR